MPTSITSSCSSSTPTPNSTTIEDLSQPLILRILSFLYIQDAIQTSLVSRNFRYLWHSMPSLHFDIYEFYSRLPIKLPYPRNDNTRNMFVEFVAKTLLFRQLNPLTKLQVKFEYANFHEHKFHVQSWIRYAINSSVSEIDLDLNPDYSYRWNNEDEQEEEEEEEEEDEDNDVYIDFDFHFLDISNSCVNVLKLSSCNLILPPNMNPIKFVSLKSIQLTLCLDAGLCNLLARCVNLETLKLIAIQVSSPEGLRICSATLKELYLDSCLCVNPDCPLDLDICCPNLRKISLIGSDIGEYTNKDATLLVEAWVEFLFVFREENYNQSWGRMLRYFTNISTLEVWEKLLESHEVPAGCERIAPNVKHLELYCAYNENDLVGLAALLKLLPKLEILGLRNRGVRDENLHEDYILASTVFNMPRLKKVILRDYQKTKSEQHFIKLFKKRGIELVHLNKKKEDDEVTFRRERMIDFVRH